MENCRCQGGRCEFQGFRGWFRRVVSDQDMVSCGSMPRSQSSYSVIPLLFERHNEANPETQGTRGRLCRLVLF